LAELEHDRFSQPGAKIGVVGLGYVGLPLALLFAEKGFNVTGIDIDDNKLKMIKKGESYIEDILDKRISKAVSSKNLLVTDNFSVIKELEAVIICVPTPLTKEGTPDLQYLEGAAKQILPNLKKHQLIVLESSTYPGTTTEFLKPILEKSGLNIGNDLFLGYSPERIDPGNMLYQLQDIPKVISGVTDRCKHFLSSLYSHIFSQVVPVSSPHVAELSKLLENSYRLINISFVNEFAMLCDQLGIDVWEVIEAASTKPYGFHPFYPGPGIGGHCIPVDPLYLMWYAEQQNCGTYTEFLKLGDQMNKRVPQYIVTEIKKLLEDHALQIKEAKILICGVAYKKNIRDTRETPAREIITILQKMGAEITFYDPLVSEFYVEGKQIPFVPLDQEQLKKNDCIILLTDHSAIDVNKLLTHSKLIYDTRNMTKGLSGKAKVIRLGNGRGTS
jgi:UDP-N-acetyl-D-glucosamine dehydrogenase